MSIYRDKVISQLKHRTRMLEQFKCDAADCSINASVFRQCSQTWRNQGYPDIADAAAEIAHGWEIAARIRTLLSADATPSAV